MGSLGLGGLAVLVGQVVLADTTVPQGTVVLVVPVEMLGLVVVVVTSPTSAPTAQCRSVTALSKGPCSVRKATGVLVVLVGLEPGHKR